VKCVIKKSLKIPKG